MLVEVKGILEDYLGQKINHMIITKYETNDDCIGWHNDKVKTIADDSVIAVLSLGAERRFQLRATPTKSKNPPLLKEFHTADGSLITMSFEANEKFQHCVAPYDEEKGDGAGVRVSIVFRFIKNFMTKKEIEAKVKEYHERKNDEEHEQD
jgi:alkylated DNA repair dioxygenase AlkB